VDVVLGQVMPQSCCDQVPERVGMVVQHHFRLARRSGREIDEHRVSGKRLLLSRNAHRVVGDRGRIVQFERVTDPSRAFAVHEEPAGERGALLGNFINLPRVLEARDDHPELLGIQSVPDVFWGEHRGAGADHGAELDQGYHEHPPLGDPGQDKEDFIPSLDPVLDQDVGCLVGEVLQVTEGKFLFASLLADPDHRELVPVLLCPCVNNVVAKIEVAGDSD